MTRSQVQSLEFYSFVPGILLGTCFPFPKRSILRPVVEMQPSVFPKTWQTNKIVCVTVIRLAMCESTVGSNLGLLGGSTDILCKGC